MEGKYPRCEKRGVVLKKGVWSAEEDQKLMAYINRYGIWNWSHMPKAAGLSRTGKSCRLRWMNYLRPNIKHGKFTKEEEETIVKLHEALGNRWAAIAAKIPGRTDNDIKNYWNTHLRKRVLHGDRKFSTSADPAYAINDDGVNLDEEKGGACNYPVTIPPMESRNSCENSLNPDETKTVSKREVEIGDLRSLEECCGFLIEENLDSPWPVAYDELEAHYFFHMWQQDSFYPCDDVFGEDFSIDLWDHCR